MPHTTLEQAIRSLKCAQLHLGNAASNRALAEVQLVQSDITDAALALNYALTACRNAQEAGQK